MKTTMKIMIATLFYLTVAGSLNAQYLRTYTNSPGQGVRFAAIVPVAEADPTANLYVAGANEGYLVVGEIEQDGDFVWSTRVNAKDTSLIINQMIRDSEGNLVMVGTAIAGELGKAFILKFDPVMKTVTWFRRCTSNTFFWDVTEMGPGGDYLVGGQETNNGTGAGSDDITLKFKRVSGAVSVITNLNKNMNESVESVLYDDATGSMYSTGRYELSGGVNKFRICLNNFESDGTVNWTRGYIKGTGSSGRFYSEDMIREGENIVIVGCGDDVGTSTLKNLWFIKTDANGEALITKKLDVVGASSDGLIAGIKPYGDGYILYGSLHNGTKFTDAFLISTDLEGNVNWSKSYPFRLRTPTTGLYCTGAIQIIGENVFVVGEKLNDSGDLEGVLMKVSGATGELSDCDVNFSITVSNLTNFDDNFTLEAATVSLSFPNTFPGVKPFELEATTSCQVNGFTESTNIPQIPKETTEIIITPNPTSNTLLVKLSNPEWFSSELRIYTLSGEQVYIGKFNNGIAEIDASGWSVGAYTIRVYDPQSGIESSRFVKQ